LKEFANYATLLDDPKVINETLVLAEESAFPSLHETNQGGQSQGVDDAEVNLTVIEIPDISESGVESLFKRR